MLIQKFFAGEKVFGEYVNVYRTTNIFYSKYVLSRYRSVYVYEISITLDENYNIVSRLLIIKNGKICRNCGCPSYIKSWTRDRIRANVGIILKNTILGLDIFGENK